MPALVDTFDRVEPFACVIPAGTAQATPIERDTSFPPGRVISVEVLVPPGHNGRTGFAVAQAHQPIHPNRAGAFIVSSNETFQWPIEDQAASGSWSLFGYNTDAIQHTFYVRFYVVETTKQAAMYAPAVAPLVL